MKIFRVFAALAGLTFVLPAMAANQQVDPDSYRSASRSPFYGRSDGLYFTKSSKIPWLIQNGDGFFPLGPTYTEDFGYGAGLGLQCSNGLQGLDVSFELGTGADDACNDTCDELSPPAECVIGFANAGDLVACTGTTADTCLCARADAPDTNCGQAVQTGDMRRMDFGKGIKLMAYQIGATTAGSNLPATVAGGLDISADQADDEGVELFAGMYGASGRPMIVGDDPAFKFCVTGDIDDADGTDDFHVGFRGVEAPNDVFDDYTNVASIGYTTDEGTTAAIVIETIVAGAATVSTDTTMSNSTSDIQLCVLVGDAGEVTYTVDGGAPTTTAALTLADGLAVVPFVHLLQSDQVGVMTLSEWEVSYQ